MAVVYLRIEADRCKYGKYFLNSEIVTKYSNLFETIQDCDLNPEIEKPSRAKFKYDSNGIFLHYLLQELIYCDNYRKSFVRYHVTNDRGINRILFNLQNTTDQIIDYNWNERLSYLVREKCELEHALSWLSTLGGAFSALGDYFGNFALVAGKISYHQLLLALRMGDPTIVSRCKLYFSLSLIQRHKFKFARKIIENEYHEAKAAVIVDTRLVKMCLGIWSKLRYEHQRHRERRRYRRRRV